MVNSNVPPVNNPQIVQSGWEDLSNLDDSSEPDVDEIGATDDSVESEIATNPSEPGATDEGLDNSIKTEEAGAPEEISVSKGANLDMVENFTEKDRAKLKRLQGMAKEMHDLATSKEWRESKIEAHKTDLDRRQQELRKIREAEEKRVAADKDRMKKLSRAGTMTLGEAREEQIERQRQEAVKELGELIPNWISRGEKYIPEGRREEWGKHVNNLVEADPKAAEDRIETALDLMAQLGDDRIELADLHDRASNERVNEIVRDFRKFGMSGPLAGTDLGSIHYQKVDENGERMYDEYGNPVYESDSYRFVSPLTKRDRGILEDVLAYSPQGVRVFRGIWSEEFWSEEDYALVAEAEDRNATDCANARKEAEENGILEKIIHDRRERQGNEALANWVGFEGQRNREELFSYSWSKLLDDKRLSGDGAEATIEIFERLNKNVEAETATEIMEDYELDDGERDLIRRGLLFLHPRGAEFYEADRGKKLTAGERDLLKKVTGYNELLSPGITERLEEAKQERYKHSYFGQLEEGIKLQREQERLDEKKRKAEEAEAKKTPEQRAAERELKTIKRNAKEAEDAQIRMELEKRKAEEAEKEIEELKKSGRPKGAGWERDKYDDDLRRAEKALATAKLNYAGAMNIYERAMRGEM